MVFIVELENNLELDLPESIKEIRFYQGVSANSEFFDSVIKKLEDMFASKPQPERTEQKAEEDVSEFMDILTNLYEATVSYRNAFRSGVQDDIYTASSNMANLLQKLYYICEKGKYANGKKRMIQKCTEIIDQFNRYVPCYNAFSNCTNKISIEAQEYARCAENKFKKLVEKICAVLGD